jgi:hypothetical protein
MLFFQIVMCVLVTACAFLANPNGPFGEFWPPAPGSPTPMGAQIFFYILLNIFEAASFAAALILIVTAWPKKAVKPLSLTETRLGFVSLMWMLGNWWIHDSLHVHIGLHLSGLLIVEYAFHVTTMFITGYVIYLCYKVAKREK